MTLISSPEGVTVADEACTEKTRCLPVLYLSRRTVLIITKAAREGGRKEERRKVGRKDKEGP